MKNIAKIVSFLIFFGFLSNEALSQQQACQTTGTTIFYGNGILTPLYGPDSAQQAIHDVQVVLKNSLGQAQRDSIEYDVAYNNTNGRTRDLLESVLQDLQTDTTRFWRILGGLEPMPDWFKNRFLQLAVAADKAALVNNADLGRHLAQYKLKFLEGKKVVLVAHSQGNFFANQAYELLESAEQKQSFGIVSVANPDSFVADGRGLYTTLTTDLVIAAIREAKIQTGLPSLPLPANLDNGHISPDFPSGHNFRTAYLEVNSFSMVKILGDTINTINTLPAPPQVAGQGIVTVALTWGEQPDVDLHAFEPNGAHVYYANLRGPSGYLDVDDVSSFGPEHYYVSCSTLEAGTYKIGVNYYYGLAPELARVNIKAGPEVRDFAIPLSTAVGSSGDNTPNPVANINVTGDTTIGFSFDIQGAGQ